MDTQNVINALSAIAQEHRLRIFRLLIQAGADGMRAGIIGERLNLAGATLSFHLKEMKYAGIVTCERKGREQVYRADYDAMTRMVAYLMENCCTGSEDPKS